MEPSGLGAGADSVAATSVLRQNVAFVNTHPEETAWLRKGGQGAGGGEERDRKDKEGAPRGMWRTP